MDTLDIIETLARWMAGIAIYGCLVFVAAGCMGRSTETGDDEG